MPAKTIQQQPVTMAHVSRVIFIIFGTGIDGETQYRPVDETGTQIGETRTYTEHFTGPNATRVRDFLAAELLPNVNAEEGT